MLPMVRLASGRLPAKALRPLGPYPLVRWSLDTMKQAADTEGVDFCVAVPERDRDLINLVQSLGLQPLLRDDESADGETAETIYNAPLKANLGAWDYVIIAGCCSPFVDVEEYRKAIQLAKLATHQGVAAFRRKGWVWNGDCDLVVGDAFLNTKTSPTYFMPAHVFDILRVEWLGTARMFDNCLPVPIEDSLRNRIHVDTEDDFRLAELYLGVKQFREGG